MFGVKIACYSADAYFSVGVATLSVCVRAERMRCILRDKELLCFPFTRPRIHTRAFAWSSYNLARALGREAPFPTFYRFRVSFFLVSDENYEDINLLCFVLEDILRTLPKRVHTHGLGVFKSR